MFLKYPIKKITVIVALIVFTTSIIPETARAAQNPLAVPNNPFGIHILNEGDLEDAASLVNSSGGDWGYVTLVIRKDERDKDRWQAVFNKMRRLHLIPIVRIATNQTEGGWEKPSFGEIDGWASFLNSLNWVTKNRYIIIGNEPNHATEWGGEINPEEYSDYLFTFTKKLKASSLDFFVLPAGLDASAPTGREHMSEDLFLQRMHRKNPEVFENIDGWTSHSYPNPGFSASEDRRGRGTVTTYDWELDFLESLGVGKKLPVFITETGWAHDRDTGRNSGIDVNNVGKRLLQAYNTAWRDERIVAITPFVLNYQNEPFEAFSWKNKEGEFYPFYYEVKNHPKPKGEPIQNNTADVITIIFPPLIPEDGKLTGVVYVKNTGQAIWKSGDSIQKSVSGYDLTLEPIVLSGNIEPGQTSLSLLKLNLK